MKRFVAFFSCILLMELIIAPTVHAASVEPKIYYNNSSEQEVYAPNDDHIYYVIPDSNIAGPHTAVFDESGEITSDGSYLFTVVIGTGIEETYTKAISWSSNFPVEAIMVSGTDAMYLYEYPEKVRGDINLVAPANSSGTLENIEYIAFVFDPEVLPAMDPSIFNSAWGYIIFASLTAIFFLLGLIFGNMYGITGKIDPPAADKQSPEIPNSNQTGTPPITPPINPKPDGCSRERPVPRNPRGNYYKYY